MPTASGGYYLKDGTRVPSVTTILGVWEKDALKRWAAMQEREYISKAVNEFLDNGATRDEIRILLNQIKGQQPAYDIVTKRAATIGTVVHQMADDFLSGQVDTAAVIAEHELTEDSAGKALTAFDAFRRWADGVKFEPVMREQPLVSELYRFGGTPDLVSINGRRSMGDFKTSSGVYHSYLQQVAAYGKAWDENHPEEPIDGGYYAIRFDKERGDFHHHSWPELDDAWEAFTIARRAYDLLKELKKRCK